MQIGEGSLVVQGQAFVRCVRVDQPLRGALIIAFDMYLRSNDMKKLENFILIP